MTNLSSPAANAAASKPMSDVIDALKRLERIGSENSKTTQKLMEAARSLEALICKQYENAGIGDRERIRIVKRDRVESQNRPPYDICRDTRYHPSITLEPDNGQVSVSATRDAALAFSRDVAKGLIDWIAEDLEQREQESRAALGPLEVAIDKMKAKNQ